MPKQAEMQELKQEKSSTASAKAEAKQRTDMSITDRDTMLGMTVLLLACLSLALLAHVLV